MQFSWNYLDSIKLRFNPTKQYEYTVIREISLLLHSFVSKQTSVSENDFLVTELLWLKKTKQRVSQSCKIPKASWWKLRRIVSRSRQLLTDSIATEPQPYVDLIQAFSSNMSDLTNALWEDGQNLFKRSYRMVLVWDGPEVHILSKGDEQILWQCSVFLALDSPFLQAP